MEKEFVPYEIAVQLKEIGFNEPCFTYYKNDQLSDILELVKNSEMKNANNEIDEYVSAPTFSQCFKWFRDKHNLLSIIDCYISTPLEWFIRIDKISNDSLDYKMDITEESEDKVYLTYEEAEIACLGELIKIIKNKI